MKKILSFSLLAILVTSVLGCSSLRFPGVYRLVVLQGNYLEQDMVDQLEVGMNRRQVRYVMGTPLISDTFNPDRWDYYFNIRRGEQELSEYHFTVFFEGDKLAHWEGEYEPKAKTAKEQQEDAIERTRKKEEAKFK